MEWEEGNWEALQQVILHRYLMCVCTCMVCGVCCVVYWELSEIKGLGRERDSQLSSQALQCTHTLWEPLLVAGSDHMHRSVAATTSLAGTTGINTVLNTHLGTWLAVLVGTVCVTSAGVASGAVMWCF